MVKRRILIVDQDDQTLHTLAHALRRAGFWVACNPDPHAASAALPKLVPDALIVATALPYVDGFEFVRRIRNQAAYEHLPVVFVTEQISIEDKATTLELHASDYLAKPLVPADIIARLRTIFDRPAPQASRVDPTDAFSGDLRDLDVAALCNMMQSGNKSGTLTLQRAWAHGFVYFIGGHVIDAEVAQLHGAQAVYQLLRWHEGTFCMSFDVPDRPVALTSSTHALLLEGMHRFDAWTRWLSKLPPLGSVLQVQPLAIPATPEGATCDPVLNLVDGQRTIAHILEASIMGDVETAEALARHIAQGHIAPAPAESGEAAMETPQSGADAPWSVPHAPLLPGPMAPPRPTLFYGASPASKATIANPVDIPRSPEEAFGLPPAPHVDQSYLDAPASRANPWKRRLFWLCTTSVGSMLVGWWWTQAQR